MTREEHVAILTWDIVGTYAHCRAERPDWANLCADANLAAVVSHMVQAHGHRVAFDILSRSADAVLRAGNLVSA